MLWLVIGLGMLLVIAGVGAYSLREIVESDFWVNHTREVISTNQQLMIDVRDAEGAERGYIITGDEQYVGPYQAAVQDVPQTLARLRQLTVDNPQQQQRVQDLGDLVALRLETLNQGVQQRRNSGFDSAQAVVQGGQGQIMAKKIGDASRAIEDQETRLLQQRENTRQTRVRAGFIAGIIAGPARAGGLRHRAVRCSKGGAPEKCRPATEGGK